LKLRVFLATALVTAVGVTGAASAHLSVTAAPADAGPPGDIPDNQAFVEFAPPGAGFAVKVPEGWARTTKARTTQFTDKLNTVVIEWTPAPKAASVSSVRNRLVPRLRSQRRGFRLGTVSATKRNAGSAILITYRALSRPDEVTGKTIVDDVEEYLFFHKGVLVTVTLSGPKGADNVDPWRIVTDSLRWT
jgi:hypothetical protein